MPSRLRIAALTLIGIPIVLVVVGASYQLIESYAEEKRSPEAGRLVDIGGYRLLINCTGSGSPTVILESGLGDISIGWNRVQTEISKFARVCSYDRAGYGGSDAGPMPRTSEQIAKELHSLLQNSGEAPPYLLVGHSLGGYNVRVYNGDYPREVMGLVLVDAPQEDQYGLLPVAWNDIYDWQLKRYKKQAGWSPFLVGLGIARFMLWRQGNVDEYTYLIQPKLLRARANELEMIKVSAQQARASDNMSGKPLAVVTAGKNSDQILVNGLSKQDLDDFYRIWITDLQVRLVHLSAQGKQIIVADSGHNIPAERPDTIVRAVREMATRAGSRSSVAQASH
jgi:pimeloyl-ACP methyl ester carboxylesterase